MAFDILQTLGLKRKRADVSPILQAQRPPATLTDIPVGASLNEQILAALKGREGFAKRVTDPLVAQRKARFREVERPELEAAFSARGLGRSTIAGRDIGRAGAQVGRDINQIIASGLLGEEAERARVQNLALQFTGAEAGQRGIFAGEEARRAGIVTGAEETARGADIQTLNQLIGGGFQLAGTAIGRTGVDEQIRQLEEAIRASKRRPFTTVVT